MSEEHSLYAMLSSGSIKKSIIRDILILLRGVGSLRSKLLAAASGAFARLNRDLLQIRDLWIRNWLLLTILRWRFGVLQSVDPAAIVSGVQYDASDGVENKWSAAAPNRAFRFATHGSSCIHRSLERYSARVQHDVVSSRCRKLDSPLRLC